MKKLGVVHGRFQIFHFGHRAYVLEAFKHADFLYIGVCTPAICTSEEAAKTGYPCTAELNPLSFDERKETIESVLDAENIPRVRYSVIPFPSDYQNLGQYVPSGVTFFMTVYDDLGRRKTDLLKTLGYDVSVLMDIDTRKDGERGGDVRECIESGKPWEHLVPPAAADIMKRPHIWPRLRKN